MSNFKSGDKLRVVDSSYSNFTIDQIVTFDRDRNDGCGDIYVKECGMSWKPERFVLHVEPAAAVKVRTLKGDVKLVFEKLVDGAEHSVQDIAYYLKVWGERSGVTTATITARIRDLRKPHFGGFNIQRRQEGKKHFYRLVK
jgi:hypothetical protein